MLLSNSFVTNYDPTHTTALRNVFAIAMSKRFNELIKVINKSVVTNDCFGLTNIQFNQMTPANWQAFGYLTSAEKVNQFMNWLQQQVDAGILDVRIMQQIGGSINQVWLNQYIFDSYKRGVIRARYELKKAGFEVPSIDETGGIEIAMATPFHIDRLGLLYTRVYSDLKGVTDQMDSIISRILAQGITDGDGPALLARKLVAAINGEGIGDLGLTDSLGRFIPAKRRADILARTEIIRAHHVATIQEYRNWAIHGVIVKGEWQTAEDNRVCSKCEKLQGQVFDLDTIEGMVPAHPQCRCIALPYLINN